ncbi:MAG: 4Fe-4S binding protein [Desulfovibrio sp.]|uniref:4Fe-4S binding protein n=1 Tax=Desulfovibrio sp. 7SRBS1 TaxID=3378064 RepID=UPI003B3E788F
MKALEKACWVKTYKEEKGMDARPTTYIVNGCRGATDRGCPRALPVEADWLERLGKVVEDAGWPEFLLHAQKDASPAGPKKHTHFRIAVAACPNGCSRPHIADLGLIRAVRPTVNPDSCIGCGVCRQVCPDGAIRMNNKLPVIDREVCQRCGRCIAACPSHSLLPEHEGWRVLVGGHLGRHPRLGLELPGASFGTYSGDEVESLLHRMVCLYMRHSNGKGRFGNVLEERGGAEVLFQGGE